MPTPKKDYYRVIISRRFPDLTKMTDPDLNEIYWKPEEHEIIKNVSKNKASQLVRQHITEKAVCYIDVVNQKTYELKVWKGPNFDNRQ